jgi:hypothetical protein
MALDPTLISGRLARSGVSAREAPAKRAPGKLARFRGSPAREKKGMKGWMRTGKAEEAERRRFDENDEAFPLSLHNSHTLSFTQAGAFRRNHREDGKEREKKGSFDLEGGWTATKLKYDQWIGGRCGAQMVSATATKMSGGGSGYGNWEKPGQLWAAAQVSVVPAVVWLPLPTNPLPIALFRTVLRQSWLVWFRVLS